jgi:hypothetical protein
MTRAFVLLVAMLCAATTRPGVASVPLDVWVVAPSVSTSMEARRIMAKLAWTSVSIRKASAALVVVRSGLYNPLRGSYDSQCELKEDADRQLNIAGTNFHVYVYDLRDDLSARQVDHQTYKAE